MKALITGTSSGLGRYLHARIGGTGISRRSTIIHCASDYVTDTNDSAWVRNTTMAQSIAKLPHKKLVFISSGDIYRNTPNGRCKKICESLIAGIDSSALILRVCGLILGKYQRANCITKIISSDASKFTLSGKSEFGYIYNEEILQFIVANLDATGIHDVGRVDMVELQELADAYNNLADFGKYVYEMPKG